VEVHQELARKVIQNLAVVVGAEVQEDGAIEDGSPRKLRGGDKDKIHDRAKAPIGAENDLFVYTSYYRIQEHIRGVRLLMEKKPYRTITVQDLADTLHKYKELSSFEIACKLMVEESLLILKKDDPR